MSTRCMREISTIRMKNNDFNWRELAQAIAWVSIPVGMLILVIIISSH